MSVDETSTGPGQAAVKCAGAMRGCAPEGDAAKIEGAVIFRFFSKESELQYPEQLIRLMRQDLTHIGVKKPVRRKRSTAYSARIVETF